MAPCHKDGILCHKYGIFCQYAILLACCAILRHIEPYLWHIMQYFRLFYRFYRHVVWFSHDVHGKMADSGAAVAADADAAALGTQIQIGTVGMPGSVKPQDDVVSVFGLGGLSETSAVRQPAASIIEGENFGDAAEERDDSEKQGASKGRTVNLPLMSSTHGDDSSKSPEYDRSPPHEGDRGVDSSPLGNADAEEAGQTVGKVGIVYPLGGEEADAVNYPVGASLLAKALGATVYPFTDKQSLFRAIEKAVADQVDTLFLIGHGSENGSFGPSPNERLKTTAAEVVSKLLRAKLTQVVLVCCCAGTIALKYSMQVCGRTHDIAWP